MVAEFLMDDLVERAVVITDSTARSLMQKIDLKKFGNFPTEDLYKLPLHVLSDNERRWLAAARMFIEAPELYITYAYSPTKKPKDSGRFVYAEQQKSFHTTEDCNFLKRDYINYSVPVEIAEEEGAPRLDLFRKWFLENLRILHTNPDLFVQKMKREFSLKNPPKIDQISRDNTGAVIVDNKNLKDIEQELDMLIKDMSNKKYTSAEGSVIRELGNRIDFGSFDDKTKEILKLWRDKKSILKSKLLTYFRVKYNPEMKFQKSLLEELGLKPCSACFK